MKYNLNKIIFEEINKVMNKDSNLIDITDIEIMKKYIDEIWNIFIISYNKIGGFLGARNKTALLKNSSLMTLCLNNNKIIACAAYRKLGGDKVIGIGCDQTELGKEGIKDILKRDIENYADFHWAEVSGVIEHWMKKYDGFPIPNVYASLVLGKKPEDIELSEDGLHYSRIIGMNGDKITKSIYGFRNEDIFDRVTNDIEEYIGFKNIINNSLKESFFNYTQEESQSMYIIDFINDCYNYRKIDELTPSMHNALAKSVLCLKNSSHINPTIKSYVQIGEYLLSDMEVFELHKIKVNY